MTNRKLAHEHYRLTMDVQKGYDVYVQVDGGKPVKVATANDPATVVLMVVNPDQVKDVPYFTGEEGSDASSR